MMSCKELNKYYNKNIKGHTDEEFNIAYDAMSIMADNNINSHALTKKDRKFIAKKLHKSVKEIKVALKLLERWSYYVEEHEKSLGYRPLFVG